MKIQKHDQHCNTISKISKQTFKIISETFNRFADCTYAHTSKNHAQMVFRYSMHAHNTTTYAQTIF